MNRLPVDTGRWWDAALPSLRDRIRAFTRAFLMLGIEDDLQRTLAAEPTRRTEHAEHADWLELDVYAVWYVLHRERSGDDRTTLLYKRKVGETVTTTEYVRESGLEASLMPLDPGWPTAPEAADDCQEVPGDA